MLITHLFEERGRKPAEALLESDGALRGETVDSKFTDRVVHSLIFMDTQLHCRGTASHHMNTVVLTTAGPAVMGCLRR